MLRKFVIGFIAFVFVLIICWFGLIGYVGYKAATSVQDKGISGVVQDLWCGKTSNCQLPTLPANDSNKK